VDNDSSEKRPERVKHCDVVNLEQGATGACSKTASVHQKQPPAKYATFAWPLCACGQNAMPKMKIR
jgi:hypothetical protein